MVLVPTANEKILQEQITHGVGLARVENGVVRRLLRIMTELDKELSARIAELVARLKIRFSGPDLRKAARLRQLEDALGSLTLDIRKLNNRTFTRMGNQLLKPGKRWGGILTDIAGQELRIQQKILGEALQGLVGVVRPSIEHVVSIVNEDSFGGARFRDWTRDLSARRLKRFETEIRKGLLADESIPQIMKRTRSVVKISRRDAETWVRSAVQHTAGETRDALFASNKDLLKAETWIATLDDRTCLEFCVPRDQLKYSPVEHEPLGHEIPWGEGPGRIHPRCVPGDTLVAHGGAARGVTRRPYEGDLVVIRTASGNQLACTPNHPVLTDRGWVPARLLNEVGHVISDKRTERGHVGHEDAGHVPTTIHEIAKAFLDNAGVFSVEVPVAAEDFHGDGLGSKIAIVGSDWKLRNRMNSSIREHLLQMLLVQRGELARFGKFPESISDLFFDREFPAADCRMRFAGKSEPFRGAGDIHSGLLLLGAVSKMYAGTLQAVRHNAPAEQHELGNATNSYSGGVEELGAFDIDWTRMSRDTIVDLHSTYSRCDVFNMETDDATYVAEGIITHNCRCSSGAALVSWKDLGLPFEDIPPEFRRSMDGTVPAETNIRDWAEGQSLERLTTLLGKKRALLVKKGHLDLDDLFDVHGKPWTLEELMLRERRAFGLAELG